MTRTPWKRPRPDHGDCDLWAGCIGCLVLLVMLWGPIAYRTWVGTLCNPDLGWANCKGGW